MQHFDHEVDVVVVGSGAGGMATAWAASTLGLEALVLEKADVFGGNSALSGGGAWLPNAPAFLRLGERDDVEKLLQYLQAIAPTVSTERHLAYLSEGPKLAEALERTPYFREAFTWIKGYSDYHPELGGNPLGRGLWPTPIKADVLGADAGQHRGKSGRLIGAPRGLWMTSAEFHDLIALRWGTWRGYRLLVRLAWRVIVSRVTGKKTLTGGAALMTRFRLLLRDAKVPLWLSTPMRSLLTDDGDRVVGVVVEREGKQLHIGARKGVVLAAGGFEGNADMRKRYQPAIRPGLTQGSLDNTGDAICAGEAVGAALDLMDDAWWMPAAELPAGAWQMVAERAYPRQFIVNSDGKRYVNEAAPYTDFVHAQLKGHETGVGHIPSFMILDDEAMGHYLIAGHLPGRPLPAEWFSSGLVKRAGTLEELAGQIGVPPDNLQQTAARFNALAREGRDEDFHRGESPYDRWYGNPRYTNPNLGEVSKPPFYAFSIVISDLGTKGGLLTDEHAQVLRKNGSVIAGLYATGNSSASVMGHGYAGPGATIGPAMTFGWIAAHRLARAVNYENDNSRPGNLDDQHRLVPNVTS